MRRDLEEYLIVIQKQRDEMVKAVNEANELAIKGEISTEQVNLIQNYFNQLEANYQRVLYCRYLYNLPPKFIQKWQQKKLAKELQKFKEVNADGDSVKEENDNCLEKVKEEING